MNFIQFTIEKFHMLCIIQVPGILLKRKQCFSKKDCNSTSLPSFQEIWISHRREGECVFKVSQGKISKKDSWELVLAEGRSLISIEIVDGVIRPFY